VPDPTDPIPTVGVPQDRYASVASGAGETAPHAGSGAPTFGPPTAPGEVGTLGPYRVVKELGKGGMGAVYLALDPRLDRKLALKVMLPEFAANRDAKERFLREAKAAAKISHDNVVTVYEADERAGIPYIAMQFLQGYPLDQFLKEKGTPPLAHVIRIAREAALGLGAAHELGLVHRDIKPANLWLEAPNGRVKVLDFGLAKPIGSDAELTRRGAIIGTPAYMSPEQARGLKVDVRTDLFSLGAVLYRLCTGKTPFAGEHVMAVLAALLAADPTPVRALNPNVPESLAQLIHQLLAKKPEARPQTASEVAKSLRVILDQMLAPNALAVAPGGAAPAPPSGDVSASLPVVVHPVPHQPPVVVPMHVTAAPESAFANLGADDDEDAEATQAEPATAAPGSERKTGGKGVLIAAGLAVLLAAVAGAVVVSQMSGKKEPEAKAPEAKAPDAGATSSEKGKGDPKGPTGTVGPLQPTHKNSIGMEFVKVPKGRGWLGGGGGKQGETKVEFKEDFYLGKYEVTQEEWEAITGLTPSEFKRGNVAVKDIADAELKRFPVERVSWYDCQLFIKKLNEREKESGWVYRLPKEAEWEYACRGWPVDKVDKVDSAFDYYFAKPTNVLSLDLANYAPEVGKGLQRSCRVGSYNPNMIGLYDMHGNVWEWCEDTSTNANGVSYRAFRGGHWCDASGNCRAAVRVTYQPSFRYFSVGLRLARVPSAPAGK
jgi:formylglycine-generating enzyme required for sulfatase activity